MRDVTSKAVGPENCCVAKTVNGGCTGGGGGTPHRDTNCWERGRVCSGTRKLPRTSFWVVSEGGECDVRDDESPPHAEIVVRPPWSNVLRRIPRIPPRFRSVGLLRLLDVRSCGDDRMPRRQPLAHAGMDASGSTILSSWDSWERAGTSPSRCGGLINPLADGGETVNVGGEAFLRFVG